MSWNASAVNRGGVDNVCLRVWISGRSLEKNRWKVFPQYEAVDEFLIAQIEQISYSTLGNHKNMVSHLEI